MSLDLTHLQLELKERIIREVPVLVELLPDPKSVPAIWESASAYAAALLAEYVPITGDMTHNLCNNTMAEADIVLNDRGPLVACFSAAVWSVLRYLPGR